MNRQLRKVITKQNNLIRNRTKDISLSKSMSNLYFARNNNYLNNRYDRILNVWSTYLLRNYKKIYLDERWKHIEKAKKEITRFKNLRFEKDINTDNVLSYVLGVINDVNNAIENGKKERYLTSRLIQLRNNQISQIKAFLDEDEIETIIQEAQSYPDARNILIDRLLDYSEDGKTIVVDTRSGGERHYDVKYYANMVMRTAIREIQTQATLKAANEVGSDLVQYSIHNTDCKVCIPFEGKIYSVSGSNQMFPPLETTPPVHPNCLHSLSVVFIETLYRRGIDQYIDFSQGRSESPPFAKGWIPVAERKIV